MLIGDTKTGNGLREIILPPSTADLLRSRKKNAVSGWIFPNLRKLEKPIHPQSVYVRLKTLLNEAGLPPIRFHDLRHTFLTMALERGMDIKTLSAVLGHTSSETTIDIYSHITDTMRKQAAVKIDRQISGTEAQISQADERVRVEMTGDPKSSCTSPKSANQAQGA